MKDGVETDKCQKCRFSWDKLVNGKCTCSAIKDCDYCSSDKVCDKCSGFKLINIAVSPHTCVDSCPSGTHKTDKYCKKGP